AETWKTSDVPRFIPATSLESAKRNKESVGRKIAVAAKEAASALPEIGNHYDVSLVISSTSFQPCFPLAHVVGCSQVCVPVRPSNLQATELVDQEEVDHARDRVGTIHSGGAILQDTDVIDHREGNEVNVLALEGAGAG